MIWKLASGSPNWRRCSAYRSAVSYAEVAWPSAAQAHVARVVASTRLVSRNDRAPGSRFSAGTRTLSRMMSACHTARSDTFPSITVAS